MEKYIEVKSLIDALEQRKKQLSLWVDKDIASQRIDEIDCILDVDIVSLQQEQQERDLEKEYKEFVEDDPVYNKLVNGIVGKQIARHFYELGKNSK